MPDLKLNAHYHQHASIQNNSCQNIILELIQNLADDWVVRNMEPAKFVDLRLSLEKEGGQIEISGRLV